MSTITTLLPWILPPFLGACIGYLTNSIAIRMLFRPLHERRVFGIRVPFTPGVIPRGRYELAKSIGRMVSRELLTPEVFTERFSSPRFAFAVRRAVGRLVRDTLDTDLATLLRRISFTRAVSVINGHLNAIIRRNPRIIERLREEARRVVGERSPQSRTEFVHTLLDIEVSVFAPLWRSASFETSVGAILTRLEQPLVEHFDRQEIKIEIDRRIRRLLHYTFDQLGTVQRFVVSAGQFDRQLESRIPALRRQLLLELRSLLTEPQIHTLLVSSVRAALEERRDRSFTDVLGRDAFETLSTWDLASVVETIAEHLITPDGCGRLLDRLLAVVSKAAHSERSLSSFVPPLKHRRGAIVYALTRIVQRTLIGRADALVASLDIGRVVVDRIDSLDVERVEALILEVIRRHLRWINLFGAIVGALIGGVQILLSLFGLR